MSSVSPAPSASSGSSSDANQPPVNPQEQIKDVQSLIGQLKNDELDNEVVSEVYRKIVNMLRQKVFSPITSPLNQVLSFPIGLEHADSIKNLKDTIQTVYDKFEESLLINHIKGYYPDLLDFDLAYKVVSYWSLGMYLLTPGMGKKLKNQQGEIVEPAFFLFRKGREGTVSVPIFWDQNSAKGYIASEYHDVPAKHYDTINAFLQGPILKGKLLCPIGEKLFRQAEEEIKQAVRNRENEPVALAVKTAEEFNRLKDIGAAVDYESQAVAALAKMVKNDDPMFVVWKEGSGAKESYSVLWKTIFFPSSEERYAGYLHNASKFYTSDMKEYGSLMNAVKKCAPSINIWTHEGWQKMSQVLRPNDQLK